MTDTPAQTSEAPQAPTSAEEIPAGDFPTPPAWHLPAAAVAWGLWMIFLIWMVWFRYTH